MRQRALCTLALSALLVLGASGASLAAKASEDPVEKRFNDLEKQIKQLRSIVTQARESGQPVQVRAVTDPDPVVEGLQQKVDDLEQAAKTRNEQIDTLTHDLDQARKDAADAHESARALTQRLDKLEAAVKSQGEAASQAAAAGNSAAAAPSAPAAAVPADPDAAFKRAKQLLLEGQYEAAGGAFQGFVDGYGDSENGPEARYWLGETLFIRGLYPDAAAAYIGAIRGWPQTNWAPDAVLKLARSLIAMDKAPDACRTLDELDRRYPDAPRTVKTRADAARTQAACALAEARPAAPAKAPTASKPPAKSGARARRD